MNSWSTRRIVAAAMLAVWALRALVPAGYMPQLSEHRVAMTLCSGMAGAVQKSLPHGKATVKLDAVCPFAALSAPVLPGGESAHPGPWLIVTAATGAHRPEVVHLDLAFHSFLTRAPPAAVLA